ncbi:CAP domain-containing protein [Deinococcus aquiradiocola]|uniref:SCP domain-containing protein n=1 Tax=Deinococcus aquiradiocola TaxID=393059 RepID=A0A917PSK2_9DEIO|nr:CAP domain-containing protein [Deinococcus aquiradiocola]GGJ89430.1 hypothetical protein GCM10008939_36790 [Deinococcus aquiradiocola]
MRNLTRVLILAAAAWSGASAAASSSAEGQLLARLNEVRAQGVTCPGSGTRPVAGALAPSDLHAVSALKQASYMAQSGVISHTGPGGTTPRVRAASTGIRSVSVTEIIYMGSGLNPEAAMQWWLHSPVHCYYMTDQRYTTAGASIVRGSRGTAYVMVLTSTPR